jgi:hypothetical protein
VHEGNTLYLLPNQGSDTNWYKNLLVDPTLKISVNGVETPARGNSSLGEVKKYYTKFDVAVEVQL